MNIKKLSICLCVAIAALLFISPLSYANSEIIFMSLNNTVQKLYDSTMPVRRGGQIFVPYTVFTNNFEISGSYDSEKDQLILLSGNLSITFDISNSETYDESGEFYTNPAFHHNDTIYVCAKDLSEKMGLYFSIIIDDLTSEIRTVVRINKSSPAITDNVYVYIIQNELKSVFEEYSKKDEVPSVDQPLPDQPGINKNIRLTFSNGLSDYTEKILDSLYKYGYKAAFFVSRDDIVRYSETVRRIVSEGHTIGIYGSYYNESFYSSPEAMIKQLDETNSLLFKVCLKKTRLMRFPGGSKGVITTQYMSALSENGYRFWDWNLSCSGFRYSSSITRTVISSLNARTFSTVLELDCSAASAGAVSEILKYLSQNDYSVNTISEITSPVNFYQYTK